MNATNSLETQPPVIGQATTQQVSNANQTVERLKASDKQPASSQGTGMLTTDQQHATVIQQSATVRETVTLQTQNQTFNIPETPVPSQPSKPQRAASPTVNSKTPQIEVITSYITENTPESTMVQFSSSLTTSIAKMSTNAGPTHLPLLTEKPSGTNIEIKPANQITAKDPTKTVEYFISYALTQTMKNGTTTSEMATQTFAAIRPILLSNPNNSQYVGAMANIFWVSWLVLMLNH